MQLFATAAVLGSLVSACLSKPIELNARSNTLARPTLNVLPLGDSITWGLHSTDGNGYRLDLANDFTSYDITFVGTGKSGTMTNNENEGHCGATIAEINGFSQEAFKYKPDVVLVLAGTNDMCKQIDLANAPERLGALIDNLIANLPQATILVGTIPPIWYALPQRNAYNAAIPGVVAARAQIGKHVLEVNMSGVTQGHLADDLHPNDGGYAIMANFWATGLVTAQDSGWLPGSAPATASLVASHILAHSTSLNVATSPSTSSPSTSSPSTTSLTSISLNSTSLNSTSPSTTSLSSIAIAAAVGTNSLGVVVVTKTVFVTGTTTATVTLGAYESNSGSGSAATYSESVVSLNSSTSVSVVPTASDSSFAVALTTSSSLASSTSLPLDLVSTTTTSTSGSVANSASTIPIESPASSPVSIDKAYQNVAESAISVVTDAYNNSTKVWENIGGWIAAIVYQDIMDYDHCTGGKTYESTYGNSLLEIVTNKDLLNSVGAVDGFNDDQGWWVLAMLRAYENYGHVELLNEAIKQWKQIQASSQTAASNAGSAPNMGGLARSIVVPASCDIDGAVYWEQTPDSGFTAISTGLFAQMGAWLYAFTKDEQYRQGADLALGWLRRNMLDPKAGIMNIDHIDAADCQKGLGSLTYNTGVYLSALTSLYSSTGEAQYLEWATLTATSSATGSFGNDSSAPLVVNQEENQMNDDQSYIWRDILFRGLNEFNAVLKTQNINPDLQSKIKAFFQANYNHIQQHAKYGTAYSANWYGLMPTGTAWGTASVLSVLIGSTTIM